MRVAAIGVGDAEGALRVEGLSRMFDSLKAVDALTFVVPQGSCFALLGPNGAGKTTLISAVCGLVTPTGGSVTVGGHDIATHGQLRYRASHLLPMHMLEIKRKGASFIQETVLRKDRLQRELLRNHANKTLDSGGRAQSLLLFFLLVP